MATASTQQALLVTELGKPLTLTTSRPIPQPGPSQIQIRVTVAGLNPHDQKARDYGLFIASNLPAVISNDVVGRVTALGSSVNNFAIGDRVVSQASFSPGSLQNGLQQYAVLDADFTAKIPDDVSDDEAATLPCNTLAPLLAIFDPSTLDFPAPWTPEASTFNYANTTLLVIGGGSSCGKFGVQLAALAGFGRIVVVGGDESELKSYGATHVLDRHGGDDLVLSRIRAVVGDDLVYAYDAINPPSGQHLALNALSNTKRGKLARLLPTGPVNESKIHAKQAGYEIKNVMGSSHLFPNLTKPYWERLPQYLKAGSIKPLRFVVEHGLDADKVNEVLDRYRDGKKVIKTHIHLA